MIDKSKYKFFSFPEIFQDPDQPQDETFKIAGVFNPAGSNNPIIPDGEHKVFFKLDPNIKMVRNGHSNQYDEQDPTELLLWDAFYEFREQIVGFSKNAFEGVTNFTEYCFSDFNNLRYFVFPRTTEYIGTGIFNNCYNLSNVYYNGTREQWEQIEKAEGWNDYTPGGVWCLGDGVAKELPECDKEAQMAISQNTYKQEDINGNYFVVLGEYGEGLAIDNAEVVLNDDTIELETVQPIFSDNGRSAE